MLKIDNVKKHYKSFSLDCSMEVKKGQITGLIGQNGAGKSTAFKAVLGLIRPDGGSINVFGKTANQMSASDRQMLGVVLSDSGFSGYLTVNDIIPILKNLYKTFDINFFTDQIKRFELPTDKKLHEFSTGMKAKLKVLAAVSHDAKLLILDEPTAGLDVIARDELLLMLKEFMEKDSDRAILISSHISSDLETVCDDIYMIHRGSIVLHEDTDILLDSYAILKTDEAQYKALDKKYILYTKHEPYGYMSLTDQRRFYAENYPELTIEKSSIDSVITAIIKGERL